MDTFNAVLAEGLFCREAEGLSVVEDDGRRTLVANLLGPCVGGRVRCVAQFIPPTPPLMDRWGAGCCFWEPSSCPAGHHEDPGKMLNFSQSGVLCREGARWWLEGDEIRDLPLKLLEGHRGRLLVVSDVDPTQLSTDEVSEEAVEALSGDLHRLRGLVRKLQAMAQRD